MIIVLIFYLNTVYCKSNAAIDSILNKYPVKSDEAIVVVFMEYGSCVKCLLYPLNIIHQTEKKTSTKLKIVTFVNCERVKEIGGFKKAYGWEYPVEPDIKRQTRYKIGLKPETDICLIDSSGDIIAQIQNFEDHDKNIKILTDALEKLKK